MTERVAIGLTLWGEARGEAIEGRIAVASVLRNRLRLKRWGDSYIKVCQAPWQFSCWNANDPNRPKMQTLEQQLASGEMPDGLVRECLWIADGTLADVFRSNVGPASHYYAPAGVARPPRWIAGAIQTAAIGNHLFFANVK